MVRRKFSVTPYLLEPLDSLLDLPNFGLQSRIGQVDASQEPRLFAAVKSLEAKIEQIKQAIERLKK